MRTILLIALFSVLIISQAISQYKAEIKEKDDAMNGEVHLFALFVETINGSFEDGEQEYLLRQLDSSINC